MEFKDGVRQTLEYEYDKNGNLTKDFNKKITSIRYNCLNLPDKLQLDGGNSISNLYGSDGTKLRTTRFINGKTTTTDYCGSAIYENGVLSKVLTEDGYITAQDNKAHYFIQDHQGNTRVVVDNGGKVEELTHYYPFGGIFSSTNNVQPYKYNGKELDRKEGLDWYDYGARHYDAAIGRWHVVDPMVEKYYNWSQYAYCLNNSVKLIDPNGKQPRPARPVRRGYRNGGRFNPYVLYAREMKPQSYIQTTQYSYKGNGLKETMGMGVQNFLQEVATPGGNNVQMSRDNREGQFLSGVGDLWDTHNESMKNIFSFNTVVQYGENGIIQKSTDMVITDTKLALQQIEYERNVKSIEKQLGEQDFTGKSLKEIIEISAERKSMIQQKLGMSPKEKMWILFFNDPKSFQSLESKKYAIPEFRQN